MYRLIFIVLVSIITLGCHQYDKTPEQERLFSLVNDSKLDTLIAVFTLSTGSQDLTYLQGKLELPEHLKHIQIDTVLPDINICGNFPKEYIDFPGPSFKHDYVYQIIGKTIAVNDTNGRKNIPLFYVTEWEVISTD